MIDYYIYLIITGPYYSDHYISLEYKHMNLNSLLRYRFKFNKVAVFANAGFSLGLPVSRLNENIIKSNFQTTEKIRSEKVIYYTRSRDLSYIAGIGAEFNDIGLQFRYEAGKGIAKTKSLKSPTSSYAVLLTYSF